MLYVKHIPYVITNCGQHLFSGLTGENVTRKLQSLSLDLFFIFFYSRLFSLYSFLSLCFFLTSSGWFVISVCGPGSVRELVKYWESLWTDLELPSPITSQLNGCPRFFMFYIYIFFLKFIVTCIYVLSMWGNIMIPMYRLWLHGLYGLYGPWCPLSPKKLLNLVTHSLVAVVIVWNISRLLQ